MPRIFDIDHEVMRAQAKPRGTRDEQPVPFGNFIMGQRSFGSMLPPHVSDAMVLGLPAANRAVNLIANGVASMAPLRVFDADGTTPILPTPNIAARPNATMSTFTFWHSAVITALMRGNFVGLYADFDPTTGFPRQVVPLPPQLVLARYNGDGFLEYNFLGQTYTQLDLVHVPGLVLPGSPWGVGIVENFRRSLGAALEMQFMAADVYHRGAVPTGTLEVPISNPDATTISDTKQQWIDGIGGQRVPAVIPQGWKFTPISWSPEDAQFLQSREFAVAEMAFMAGLDPTDLSASLAGGSTNMVYSNVEQREIARVTEAYGPWALRFEQAWSDLLPGAQTTRFDADRLMRMDAKTRADVDSLNIDSGVTLVDEAREAAGKPPLTPAQKAELKAAPPVAPAANAAAKEDATKDPDIAATPAQTEDAAQ